VAEALGDLYVPKSVSVVARLPRTTLGKIDKKALRAAYVAAVPAAPDMARQQTRPTGRRRGD
jgi:fatty-acyl-CoA synthase